MAPCGNLKEALQHTHQISVRSPSLHAAAIFRLLLTSWLACLHVGAMAALPAKIRGPEDTDPQRTPWIYANALFNPVRCYDSEQAMGADYTAAMDSNPQVCNATYTNTGWPADDQVAYNFTSCRPSEYPFSPEPKLPYVVQHTDFTFEYDYASQMPYVCPDQFGGHTSVTYPLGRISIYYCPEEMQQYVQSVGQIIDYTNTFCVRSATVPERDQSCPV